MLSEDKKECILEAALAAFEKLGFRKASIGEIARHAGVGKGTVYLAAKNKEDLFYQVVLRDLRRFIAKQAEIVDPRIPADQLLGKLAENSIRHLEKRPLIRWLISGTLVSELPGWAERFEKLRAMSRSTLSEIIKLGISQGRFRSDLDVDATAELLYDLQFAGYVLHIRAGRERGDNLIAKTRQALDLLLRGMLLPEVSAAVAP